MPHNRSAQSKARRTRRAIELGFLPSQSIKSEESHFVTKVNPPAAFGGDCPAQSRSSSDGGAPCPSFCCRLMDEVSQLKRQMKEMHILLSGWMGPATRSNMRYMPAVLSADEADRVSTFIENLLANRKSSQKLARSDSELDSSPPRIECGGSMVANHSDSLCPQVKRYDDEIDSAPPRLDCGDLIYTGFYPSKECQQDGQSDKEFAPAPPSLDCGDIIGNRSISECDCFHIATPCGLSEDEPEDAPNTPIRCGTRQQAVLKVSNTSILAKLDDGEWLLPTPTCGDSSDAGLLPEVELFPFAAEVALPTEKSENCTSEKYGESESATVLEYVTCGSTSKPCKTQLSDVIENSFSIGRTREDSFEIDDTSTVQRRINALFSDKAAILEALASIDERASSLGCFSLLEHKKLFIQCRVRLARAAQVDDLHAKQDILDELSDSIRNLVREISKKSKHLLPHFDFDCLEQQIHAPLVHAHTDIPSNFSSAFADFSESSELAHSARSS